MRWALDQFPQLATQRRSDNLPSLRAFATKLPANFFDARISPGLRELECPFNCCGVRHFRFPRLLSLMLATKHELMDNLNKEAADSADHSSWKNPNA